MMPSELAVALDKIIARSKITQHDLLVSVE